MLNKVVLLVTFIVTSGTLERFFIFVNTDMTGQHMFSAKSMATFGTGFVAGVTLHMLYQSTLSSEFIVTLITLIRFFHSVNAIVHI